MTDEQTPNEAAATTEPVADETSPPENDAAAAVDGEKKGGKRGRKFEKKDEVPIEELFDLSQPIKRVERPSKDAHEATLNALDADIETLKTTRFALQTKIDAVLGNNRNKNTPIGREREALNKLKNRKGLMIEQKRQIRTKLEIIKAKSDRLIGDAKSARGGMKLTNAADIEKEISKLQRKQETSSMSLADEKKLIKDIEALQAAKRTAVELKSKQGDLDSLKEERKTVQADLTAKDKEIDTIQKEIDAQSKVFKALMDKQSSERGTVDKLVEERDAIKIQMDEKFKEKTALRTQFREQTNDWYNTNRAIKAQRQIQYEEEKKRREEEHAAWLKKQEEEELKKTPYEEEMALCEYLADYLEKTYLVDASAIKAQKEEEAEKKAKADVVAVKDDPFAGLKAFNKKGDEEIYFGKGKGSSGNNKKKSKAKKAPTFTLNLDLFEQFGLLSLNPPTNLEGVSASVEELKAKKVWYSEQPRGSVPTAKDIRKANSEAAAKSRGDKSVKGNNGTARGGKKGNFTISNDDFAPLAGAGEAGGASGSDSSNWGR
eukprot:g2940.t1 g2940   contig12:1103685-1105477(+)